MKNKKGFIVSKNTPTSHPANSYSEITPSDSDLKGQTKIESAIESGFNIALGFIVAVIAQMVIFPWFDIHVTMTDNIFIATAFTVVSFIRSYLLRRAFNYLQVGGFNGK